MINVIAADYAGVRQLEIRTTNVIISHKNNTFAIEFECRRLFLACGKLGAKFNPNNINYSELILDYKAKKAALNGFLRTEKIDIELPALPETLANTFIVNRNNEFGEVLNIINQCKFYIRSLLAYCTKERIAAIQSLFEVVKAQITLIDYDYIENKNEYIVIDLDNVLRDKGIAWLIIELGAEGNSYDKVGYDWVYTKIDTIRFTHLDNVFSITVEYDTQEIGEIKLI